MIRLVLAKYLFRRGSAEHATGAEVSMAVAVLHFHDCLELFLQCVADAVGVKDARAALPSTAIPRRSRRPRRSRWSARRWWTRSTAFARRSSIRVHGPDGQWQPTWVAHTALHDTKENATFCLNFVIDAALKALDTPVLRDPWSRFTVEVEADSVPMLRFGPGENLVEEGRAQKGERFEKVRVTMVLSPGAGG